jgi:hypothetical protein
MLQFQHIQTSQTMGPPFLRIRKRIGLVPDKPGGGFWFA